ncbi:MAG TPA: type II CAAX endopeptidase family protein [Pyrinomonadaceae bacterium]
MPNFNDATPPSIPEDSNLSYPYPFQINDEVHAPDPDNPAWSSGGALLVWFVSIVLQFIVPLFFLIPYISYRGLNPSSPDFPTRIAELATTDRTGVFLQVVSILPTHILTLALLWAFITSFGKRPFLSSLGWSWAGRLKFWQSVGFGILLFVVAATVAKLLGAEKPTKLEELINSSLATRYAIAALAVFTAPFVEEFIYRGVLYSALQRTIGVRGAVFFVLALFTLIHVPQYWPNIGVIAAVGLLSIVLTVVRAYSGRLLPCIVIHLIFNLIQAVLLIIEPYTQRMLPNAEPTVPTASLILPLIHSIF